MDEGYRKTKDKRFIVELENRAMIGMLSLYVKIESKSSSFDTKESSREERIFFLSLSYGRVVELKPRPIWSSIVIWHYKENKHSSSIHRFDC